MFTYNQWLCELVICYLTHSHVVLTICLRPPLTKILAICLTNRSQLLNSLWLSYITNIYTLKCVWIWKFRSEIAWCRLWHAYIVTCLHSWEDWLAFLGKIKAHACFAVTAVPVLMAIVEACLQCSCLAISSSHISMRRATCKNWQ